MSEPITGGCHCGGVRFEAAGEPGFSAHCQCGDCRKFSGSAHKSFMMLPAGGFKLTGQVTSYDYNGGSGATITHHFCPACGAGLFSKHPGAPASVFAYASSLDDPEVFQPQMAIYTTSGPSWDHFDPALKQLERGARDG